MNLGSQHSSSLITDDPRLPFWPLSCERPSFHKPGKTFFSRGGLVLISSHERQRLVPSSGADKREFPLQFGLASRLVSKGWALSSRLFSPFLLRSSHCLEALRFPEISVSEQPQSDDFISPSRTASEGTWCIPLSRSTVLFALELLYSKMDSGEW